MAKSENEKRTLIYIRAYARMMFIEMFCIFCLIFLNGACAMFLPTQNNNITVSISVSALITAFFIMTNGSHLNPAVTIALTCIGECGIVQAIALIISQMLGSVLGAATLDAVQPDRFEGNLGAPVIADDLSLGSAFFCEFFATFFVMYLTVYTIRAKASFEMTAALVFMLLMILIPSLMFLSGACFNPARSFGPWIIKDNRFDVRGWWIYYTTTILGAVVGAFFTRYLVYYDGFEDEWVPPKIESQQKNSQTETMRKMKYTEAQNRNNDGR